MSTNEKHPGFSGLADRAQEHLTGFLLAAYRMGAEEDGHHITAPEGARYTQAEMIKAIGYENQSYAGDLTKDVAALAAVNRASADWVWAVGEALGLPKPDLGNREATLAAAKALAAKAAAPAEKKKRAPKDDGAAEAKRGGLPLVACPILPPVGTKAAFSYKLSAVSETKRTKGQVLEHTRDGLRTHEVSLPAAYITEWVAETTSAHPIHVRRQSGSTVSGQAIEMAWVDGHWVLTVSSGGQTFLAPLSGPNICEWSWEPFPVELALDEAAELPGDIFDAITREEQAEAAGVEPEDRERDADAITPSEADDDDWGDL